jgi:hypothetical protein
MRWIVLAIIGLLSLWFLAACSAPDPLTPPPLGTCTANAKLPRPPAPSQRSIPVLIAWANTAAAVANKAIDERDLCRGSYERLNAWAQSVAKPK